MNEEILTIVILTIIVFILIAVLVYVARDGVWKSEQVECRKWRSWNEVYDGFYYTGWQEEQCERYNLLPENYETKY